MNRYPLWKYLTLLVALVIGLVYTLPNFYGEAPAVQISSGKATAKFSPEWEARVQRALDAAAAAEGVSPAEAVRRSRAFVGRTFPPDRAAGMVVEVEIDSIAQLPDVLDAGPDIVLLDNMAAEELVRCVALRNERAPRVVLEASGGIRLDTVAAIAATGVDRVSTGWPTHDAPWLDVALDWT